MDLELEGCIMRLSEHFGRWEFRCQCEDTWRDWGCGGIAIADSRLIEALEELRGVINLPLIITSGFRCRKWNAKIGGSETSKHMLGLAADVLCPPGTTVDEFASMAELVPLFCDGGIGKYSNPDRLHLDVRSDGPKRWDKR